MQGQKPWPALTDIGVRQAHGVAEYLANGDRPSRLLSSDLRRAAHTASIIGERLGLEVEITPLLRERRWGIYEGQPVADGLAAEQKLCASERLPQGESREDVTERLKRLFLSFNEEGPVVVVTHGDVIREAVALLSPPHTRVQSVGNGCVVPLLLTFGTMIGCPSR